MNRRQKIKDENVNTVAWAPSTISHMNILVIDSHMKVKFYVNELKKKIDIVQ